MRKSKYDKIFLGIVILLSVLGLFIFSSASLGIISEGQDSLIKVLSKQILIGLVLGWLALIFFFRFDYKKLEKYSPGFFIFSIILTLLVFIPGLGMEVGGSKRWIDLGSLTFQPAEILKLGFVIFFAHWLSSNKEKIGNLKSGVLPTVAFISIPVLILLKQPDTGTSLSIISAGMAMFVIAGGKWKHFVLICILAISAVAGMAYMKPYILQRITTFIDPSQDPLGAGYQVRQSLIAIGSGKLTGRGFGQSIQKFNFLPEPIGDSIFAVAAEEFGFIGSSIIILIFLAFLLRGLRISSRTPDSFGRLLASGIVILIASQSFINMGAMLGILPLTGVPLLFVSQGGTAQLFALLEVGIVLNVSKHANI